MENWFPAICNLLTETETSRKKTKTWLRNAVYGCYRIQNYGYGTSAAFIGKYSKHIISCSYFRKYYVQHGAPLTPEREKRPINRSPNARSQIIV